MPFFQRTPTIDAVGTATYTVDDDLTPLGIRGEQPLDFSLKSALRSCLLIHPTMMAHTDWFRKNPYDGNFFRAEDHEFFVRTCSSSNFARLSEPLYFYREGLAGNLTNYLNTGVTLRKILRQYGPPVMGSWRTSMLIGQRSLRNMVYRVATSMGMQGRIIQRRNRRLSFKEQQIARAILAEILNTSLPGLAGGEPSRG